MSMRGTRMSLRHSFVDTSPKQVVPQKPVNRLRGIQLFRSAVRRVLMYMKWLTEIPVVEEMGDNIAVNIKLAEAQKVEKKALTLEDRSILLTSPEDRTTVERTYIFELFKKFRVFKKYSDHLQDTLSGVCYYQHLQPGRIIVQQGRVAENMYFIVTGEVGVSKMVTDHWTGELKKIDMGILSAGDIFGEIALMHRLPRSTTVYSKTDVELIFIYCQDFDDILRPTLIEEWNLLQDALVHFNYFKGWDETTMRECCILSKIQDFQADEVLLGDSKGMVNYVHFLLEGECQLVEHIIVQEDPCLRGANYKLYDPKAVESQTEGKRLSKSLETAEQKMDDLEYEQQAARVSAVGTRDSENLDYTQLLLSQPIDKRKDFDRSSIITTTLFDAITEWHKVTDVAEMLLREPSSISQQCYPSNVRTIFMQICTFYRGACFGLGENMVDRRIVSKTYVRCFLVPRYWINEHNRANIWERVKLFMDSKFPTKKELFEEFVKNRRWEKYKKDLVNHIRKEGRCIVSNVTTHDVPYSIRITEDIIGNS